MAAIAAEQRPDLVEQATGELGADPFEQIAAAGATSASGLTLGMRATVMALTRVFRRFFVPYQAAS